jgi:hypothetical protein
MDSSDAPTDVSGVYQEYVAGASLRRPSRLQGVNQEFHFPDRAPVGVEFKWGSFMRRGAWFLGLVCILAILVLGYAGWQSFAHSDAEQCYACKRPIHAHSKTNAFIEGRSRLFCCPACALSEHQQAGKSIRITQLTSFLTGKALSPDNAFVVRGSDVNMCERTKELVGTDKQSADLRYDRCAPSLIAFAQRSEAVQFARAHGGEVIPFGQVAAAFDK